MLLCFVCTGNICRSPSAALIVRAHLEAEGLGDRVEVSSAGIGGWHAGDDIDPRARKVLERRGYGVEHVAAQVADEHLDADLLVALDEGHARALRAMVADPARVRLLRSFDPAAGDEADVPDPYYGGIGGFEEIADMIEAATPGLLDWVRGHLGA